MVALLAMSEREIAHWHTVLAEHADRGRYGCRVCYRPRCGPYRDAVAYLAIGGQLDVDPIRDGRRRLTAHMTPEPASVVAGGVTWRAVRWSRTLDRRWRVAQSTDHGTDWAAAHRAARGMTAAFAVEIARGDVWVSLDPVRLPGDIAPLPG